MPQALIVVAEWVGMTIFQAATAAGASVAFAATAANVAVAATVVAEVAAIAEVTQFLSPQVGGNYGTQIDFKADPRAGIPYVVGRTGTAGNIVFTDTAGNHNNDLTYAVVLSGAGPVQEIESFTANATAVPFSGSGAAIGYYGGKMWQQQQLGAAPEPAALHWPAGGPAQPPEWTSAHKLSGMCAVLWGLRYDTSIYSAGTPAPIWIVQGVKVYDPRLDSTYPGGSGPQRMADESTWAYSENPYLHALTWCIGRHQNGSRIMGIGAPASAIDVGAFVIGANVADANGWKTGGVIYSTDDKYSVLQAFLQAGAGKPMRLGAKISCLVMQPRVSLATLQAADVVGAVSVAAGISRRNRINTVWPEYRDETQDWQLVTANDPITVGDYYAADKGQRSRQISYSLVQDVNQVAQLSRYDIENSREFTPVTLPSKPIWMGYKPGDCITCDEPEWGLNGQKMLILQRQQDPASMQVTLTLCSETDAKHAFALGQTGVAPPTPGITGVDPSLVPTPGASAWAVIDNQLTTASGETIPAIVILGGTDTAMISAIIVEYREVLGAGSYGPWVSQEYPPSTTSMEITGLKAATSYDVRIRYKNVRGVEDPSSGADLGVIVTGNFVSGDTVNVDGVPASTVLQLLDAATAAVAALTSNVATANQTIADLTTSLDQANEQVLELLGENASSAKSIISGSLAALNIRDIANGWTSLDGERITKPVADGKMALSLLGQMTADQSAFVLDVDTTWLTPTQSFAQYQTAIQATFNSQSATISQNYSTLTTANSAMASAILGTSATLNGQTTAVSINSTAIATATGQLYGSLTFKTNANGAIASMQLLSSSGAANLGAVVFDVGSFLVRDSSHPATQPLYFDAATGTLFSDHLTVRSANIADLSVQTIHVADGSLSNGISYEVDGSGQYAAGQAATPIGYSYTPNNANSRVQAVVYAEIGAPTSTQCGAIVQLFCDGNLLGQGAIYCPGSWGNAGVSIPFNHVPGAGSHTYTVTYTVTNPSGTVVINRTVLTLTELKK